MPYDVCLFEAIVVLFALFLPPSPPSDLSPMPAPQLAQPFLFGKTNIVAFLQQLSLLFFIVNLY